VKWQNYFLGGFQNAVCIHLNVFSALASVGYDPEKPRNLKIFRTRSVNDADTEKKEISYSKKSGNATLLN